MHRSLPRDRIKDLSRAIFNSLGNTTADPQGRSFVYDAENKQTSVSNGGTLGTYFYDGDGKRVKKTSTGDNTIFVYDAFDKLIEERDSTTGTLQTSYVYAGSRLLATEDASGTNYLTADHLGSPRINTDANGSVTARHDYHPFGEDVYTPERTQNLGYGPDDVRQKFTGYERDTESGLDFAQARYFNPLVGRFSSPDEFFNDTDLGDPMSWNLYVYVRNNPFRYVDPSGEQILIKFIDEDGNEHTVQYLNGKLYSGAFDKKGNFVRGDEYTGDNQYALDAKNILNELITDKESDFRSKIATLEKSKQVHTIQQDPNNPDRNEAVPLSETAAKSGIPTGSTIYWSGKSYHSAALDSAPGFPVPSFASLAHELIGHGHDFDQGLDRSNNVYLPIEDYQGHPAYILVSDREMNAVGVENAARAFRGVERRTWYGRYKLPDLRPVLKPGPSRPRKRRN